MQLINNALFNEDNKELDFFSPHDKFGKGSLSPVFTNDGIKVTTKRLDTLIEELNIAKVDLIKLDVEGFEYFVFKGGEKLLNAEDAPIVIFEFVDWAETHAMGLAPGSAQNLLITMGYILYEIRNGKLIKMDRCLTSGASNLIASKKELNVKIRS